MSPQLRQILSQTSRSFGLSIQLLPRAMRQPIGLAYLCARLSDTIADEASLGAEKRLQLLAQLGQLLQNPEQHAKKESAQELLPGLQQIQASLQHEGETQLLSQVPQLLTTLAAEPAPLRAQIQWVLEPILGGQAADIRRFEHVNPHHSNQNPSQANAQPPQPICLQNREELLHYCWQVAGCVGEFWGKLGRLTNPSAFPSAEKLPELEKLGSDYGQALQLINILRDLPEDAAQGRLYLPGTWDSAEEAWQQAGPEWLTQAREKLQAATGYCANLRGKRLRLATALPAAIGWRSLKLLQGASYSQLATRLKIPRREVYQLLAQGLLAARSQSSLRTWLTKLSQP